MSDSNECSQINRFELVEKEEDQDGNEKFVPF